MLIDLAQMAKIHKFCLVNSLLDSPMATWLTLTGTLIYSVYFKLATEAELGLLLRLVVVRPDRGRQG